MGNEIGVVFTPQEWALFAIERFGLFDKWLGGSTICDPTMGSGNLLLALIECGRRRGLSPSALPVDRLFGVERDRRHFQGIFTAAGEMYGLSLRRENFLNKDIFFLKNERSFDILLGNPPWRNFTDLPAPYKEKTKKLFFGYGLVGDSRDLLLGGSRIDIAALVLQKTIQKNLKPGGEGVFFIPLSLLLNDGAHAPFRAYTVNGVRYCIDTVFDCGGLNIFDGISTRYGLIHLRRDKQQEFPLRYHRWTGKAWEELSAKPLFAANAPLSVSRECAEFARIEVPARCVPRQGVNTCGANDVFFFDEYLSLDNGVCRVANKTARALLPKQYVFPLAVGENFTEPQPLARKWVFIPHAGSGKPLDPQTIAESPLLADYLEKNRERLASRRGTLINTWIRKGLFWALLGVGGYSFYPYKIIWEAYGKSAFRPKLFPGHWQANQALQAFMPFERADEARKVLGRLAGGDVEKYLLSLKMEGTMNWAQPGKIKRFLILLP
ncbi:MAG: hypothetical protein LBQ57_10880 [Spirochaetales bacterium]|nr:hypothetical protein [Spirochaetales bacterium]